MAFSYVCDVPARDVTFRSKVSSFQANFIPLCLWCMYFQRKAKIGVVLICGVSRNLFPPNCSSMASISRSNLTCAAPNHNTRQSPLTPIITLITTTYLGDVTLPYPIEKWKQIVYTFSFEPRMPRRGRRRGEQARERQVSLTLVATHISRCDCW